MTLAQIRKFALSLPGATEEPHFDRTSFRVRGKIFATALASDGYVNIFVNDAQREPALALYADYVAKLHWGSKVVGVRVEMAKAPAAVVKDLLKAAWATRAGPTRT